MVLSVLAFYIAEIRSTVRNLWTSLIQCCAEPDFARPDPTGPVTLSDPTRPVPSRPTKFKYEQRELKT